MSGIYPGDVQSLGDVERLASAGEWTALAALASFANRTEAVGTLAAAADKEPAFRWMWAIVNSGTGWPQNLQQVSVNLASGVKVPKNLMAAVRQFVLTQTPQQAPTHLGYRQHAALDPRQEAQERLLTSLDVRADFARELAREVIDAEEGRYWPGLRRAAFDIVGARRQKADRAFVLERAEELPARERLRPLLGLLAPYSIAEQDAFLAALEAALPIGGQFAAGAPGPNKYWEWVRELSTRLPSERLEELLRKPWAQGVVDRGNFFGGGFVTSLGLEKLENLLASDLDAAVRQELLSASAALPLEEQADLGRWTHENLDPSWSQPLRARLSTSARVSRYGPRSSQSESMLQALRDFALACDDAQTAADFSACVAPGEAVDLIRATMTSNPLPQRIGRIAAELLRRDATAFEQEVLAILDLYPEDKGRAAFLSGLLEDQRETDEPLDLEFLGPRVLVQPTSIAVLAEFGHARGVVSAALQSEDRVRSCLRVVEAAIEHLDQAVLEDVMDECGWHNLDAALYRRYVIALRKRPYALLKETDVALKSLSGPEANVISNDKLEVLLETALETDAEGLTKWVGDRTNEDLEALFATTSTTVHNLAREWAARIPPNEALVNLIVRTDASAVGSEEEFAIVRRALAGALVAKALDPTMDYGTRGDSLELAQRADPSVARGAAIAQRTTWPAPFRRRAARVLATTDPRPGDEEELDRLLEGEGDAQARQDLLTAKRNLTSGSVEQALRNLRDLVALDPEAGPDADALLPYEKWHDAFVANTDKARARVGGEPSGYIDALVTLAELMVEQAVIARFDVDPSNAPVKAKEREALHHNHLTKPKVGALLERQQLQRMFPWFPEVIVLRRLRGVHATPSGTTKPLSLTQKHVVEAESLFSTIIEGWQRSMLHSYQGASGSQG